MIISVAHQKGGVGKSTIATNLAVILGTDLFDLDKQFSSAEFNRARVESGLPAFPCYTLKESKSVTPYQTPIPHDQFVDFLLDYVGNKDKHIIIDCPGLDCPEVRMSLYCADYILTPVAASQVEVYGLQSFELIIEATEETYKKNIHTHVLINNADERAKKRTEELKRFIASDPDHFILCQNYISRTLTFWDAYEAGKAVTEYTPKNPTAASQMRLLAWEIKDELGM